jgi:hypothetical protein
MALRSVWVALVVGCCGLAQAAEGMAIAPIPLGAKAPPELQRALSEELPRALGAAGFVVKDPREIDLRVAERPELMHCTAGGCLAEEASFLGVSRLVLPRIEPTSDRDGGFTVGVAIYDGAAGREIASVVDRCGGGTQICGDATIRLILRRQAARLFEQTGQPGTLDVRATPPASCSIDGKPVGMTPWHGELRPGDHMVVLESGAQRVHRDVTIAPGRAAVIEVGLAEALRPRHGRFYVVKWLALGAGLAAAGVGAALWGIDGMGTCSLMGTAKQCPKVYDTLPEGAALVGVGGALLITSIIMIAVDKPRPVEAAIAPLPGGAAVALGGRF